MTHGFLLNLGGSGYSLIFSIFAPIRAREHSDSQRHIWGTSKLLHLEPDGCVCVRRHLNRLIDWQQTRTRRTSIRMTNSTLPPSNVVNCHGGRCCCCYRRSMGYIHGGPTDERSQFTSPTSNPVRPDSLQEGAGGQRVPDKYPEITRRQQKIASCMPDVFCR